MDLHVCFSGPDGGIRRLPIQRLPEHEIGFAITVHRSQGSEFDHVMLVLPERDAPILTRELVYTGITRARQTVEVWATGTILDSAVGRRIERTSGLRDALWMHNLEKS